MLRWQKLMLMSAATAAALILEITSATEAPARGIGMLEYALLAGAVIGLLGSFVLYFQGK